jgi:pyruvate,water dikinase
MWTARAVSYRHRGGFDHLSVSIAVVVQTMVQPVVSGVLFTGNPLNTATDEFMLNASYGLGEAVVSGAVSPDQFVVAAHDLRVKRRELGAKERRIVRAPGGAGTVTEDVDAADRDRFCLTDDEVAEVALLGRRVTEYYGGLPQDIEWALADGRVHLLQSRPVTGVEFSWDAEVNTDSEVWAEWACDDDTIWTRAWADEAWTGPQTPLFYSLRMPSLALAESEANRLRGLPEAAGMRYMTFHKAKAYFNTTLHRQTLVRTSLPFMRPGQQADWLPPSQREEAVAEPLSMGAYLKLALRMNLQSGKKDLVRWRHEMQGFIDDPAWHPDALPRLERLSEAELIRLVHTLMRREQDFCTRTWFAWVQYPRDIMSWIMAMLSWYDGDRPEVLGDLFAGTIRSSYTQKENVELCAVARIVAGSPVLRGLLEEHDGPAFFAACADSAEGRDFLAEYTAFRDRWFFRGHEDRDMYFARRGEDPWIDYRALKALLSSDDLDPEAREHVVNARRLAAVDEVVANFRRKPFGGLRAELFKSAHHYFHVWLVLRDDERWSTDRTTMCQRLVMREYGRRLKARGLIEADDDDYFLTWAELERLAAAGVASPLVRAKIDARRRDFERLWRREVDPPYWLRPGEGVDLDALAEDSSDPGVLLGLPTSSGTATGIARVVSRVRDIGTVRKGEILVCNSTDPGWTPVFSVISGIVTETGGILAHASCLSREYGLPAVQVSAAMKRIPDGAVISVDGSTGRVRILSPAGAEAGAVAEAGAAGGAEAGGGEAPT